jgi:hypothetical protein
VLTVNIYGQLCYYPDAPPDLLIEGWDLPKSEQFWRRKELPDYFDVINFDEDKNAILTPQQRAYAQIEVERCKKGYWFFSNGVPTYITGKNYFYLQWWKLEDDIHPDYRDADRRYFLFLEHWENVLWCIGIGRGKKRREGASSQATSNLIYECIFFTNSNCGLVSKTNTDSRETFIEMVAFGYNQLPIFLKPRQLNRADSITELVFAAKINKGEVGNKGMRSKVSYRAPVENAYDRGRVSRGLWDEGGKWPLDVKFSKFISKVTKTMVKGAKRVGFAECPSTVNEMTKGGGAEYKKFWDGANQFKTPGKKTKNRFVTYFTPAYDNYEGFIDKYGMSVIDEPTEEQYQYLVEKWVVKDPNSGETISEISEEDIRLGAKKYIYSRRVGLDSDLLEEEIRQNPCTVKEMFEAANTDCAFNSVNLNKRRAELEEKPVYKRKIIYYRNLDQTVSFRDIDEKTCSFYWKMTAFPPHGQDNKFKYDGRLRYPARTDMGVISVDGYSNSQSGRKYGSKASAWIFLKFDINDPENSGKFIGHLYGRPPVKEILHEQVLLAAEYHGFKAYYEFNSDDYLSYARDRAKTGYLGKFPTNSIDPTKREGADRYYGFPTTPFSLTKQLDTLIAYIEHYSHLIDFEELIENCLIFDPYDRTSYDAVVSAMIGLVSSLDTVKKPPPIKTPLVTQYENPLYGQNTMN